MTTTLESDDPTPPTAPRRRRTGRVVLFAAMVAVAVVMLYPFWVMIYNSLMTEAQFLAGRGFSLGSWKEIGRAHV